MSADIETSILYGWRPDWEFSSSHARVRKILGNDQVSILIDAITVWLRDILID